MIMRVIKDFFGIFFIIHFREIVNKFKPFRMSKEEGMDSKRFYDLATKAETKPVGVTMLYGQYVSSEGN